LIFNGKQLSINYQAKTSNFECSFLWIFFSVKVLVFWKIFKKVFDCPFFYSTGRQTPDLILFLLKIDRICSTKTHSFDDYFIKNCKKTLCFLIIRHLILRSFNQMIQNNHFSKLLSSVKSNISERPKLKVSFAKKSLNLSSYWNDWWKRRTHADSS